DPELIPIRIILDRRIVNERATARTPSRHIDVSCAIHSDGRSAIPSIPGVVAGDPELIPIRIVFDRGVVKVRTTTPTPSGHINISCGVEGDRGGFILVIPGTIVPCDPFLSDLGREKARLKKQQEEDQHKLLSHKLFCLSPSFVLKGDLTRIL